MRRKSERVKSSPSVKQPENVTRRTTRRNKKSPEKSITEEESDNTSDQASHSDSDGEEVQVSTKRGKRGAKTTVEKEKEKVTRPRRKTVNKKTQEEADAEVPAETNESDAPDDDANAQKSAADEESASTAADSEPACGQDGSQRNNGSLAVGDDAVEANRKEASPARESANDNDAIEIHFSANEVNIGEDAAEAESSQSNQEEEKSAATHTKVDEPNEAETGGDSEVSPEKEAERVVHVSTTSDSLAQDSDVATVTATVLPVSTNETNEISEKSDIDTTADRDGNVAADKENTRHNDGEDVEPKDEHVETASGQKNNTTRNSQRSKSSTLNANKENEATAKKPIVRKRKWLSSKSTAPKVQEITISTDSLKGLISDVRPVPLADVDLDSSPEPDHESDDVKVVSSTSVDYSRRSEERTHDESPAADETPSAQSTLNVTRKVSIVPEIDEPRPPSPAKHNPCNILFITNLVRPFTVLQLKGLLQRTGKIVENGFWMDKIKSKCFVKYETEE